MSDTESDTDSQNIPRELLFELLWLAFYGALTLFVLSGLLAFSWQTGGAMQWLLQAMLVWAFVCYQAVRRVELNRPDENAQLYATLGWGNLVTLLRACFLAAVAGFLFQDWPVGAVMAWVPGSLYFCGAILDRVDGYVARKTGHSSLLGNELDMLSDALGLAIASLLAFGYGQVHWTYLLFGVAYYVFHGGLIWRKQQGLPIYPLPPAMHRRAWAGFQMGFLVVALWPWFYPPITTLAGFAFMLPALIGFIVDWLFVSGRLSRDNSNTDHFFRRLSALAYSVLQPALRVLIVVLLIATLGLPGIWSGLDSDGRTVSALVGAGFVLGSALILTGVAGRAACLMLIGLLANYFAGHELHSIDAIVFCGVVWLMLFGTGRYSLWLPDDHWLNRYDGA